MARSPPKYHVDLAVSDAGGGPNLFAGQRSHRSWNNGASRKVEFVDGGMHRVDFDRGDDIEAGLLETQAEAASASEEIDANGSVLS